MKTSPSSKGVLLDEGLLVEASFLLTLFVIKSNGIMME